MTYETKHNFKNKNQASQVFASSKLVIFDTRDAVSISSDAR